MALEKASLPPPFPYEVTIPTRWLAIDGLQPSVVSQTTRISDRACSPSVISDRNWWRSGCYSYSIRKYPAHGDSFFPNDSINGLMNGGNEDELFLFYFILDYANKDAYSSKRLTEFLFVSTRFNWCRNTSSKGSFQRNWNQKVCNLLLICYFPENQGATILITEEKEEAMFSVAWRSEISSWSIIGGCNWKYKRDRRKGGRSEGCGPG